MTVKEVLRRRRAALLVGQVVSAMWFLLGYAFGGEHWFVIAGVGGCLFAAFSLCWLLLRCPRCRTSLPFPGKFVLPAHCAHCSLDFNRPAEVNQLPGARVETTVVVGSGSPHQRGWDILLGAALVYGSVVAVSICGSDDVLYAAVSCIAAWATSALFVIAYYKEERSVVFRALIWLCENFSCPTARWMAFFYATLAFLYGVACLIVIAFPSLLER